MDIDSDMRGKHFKTFKQIEKEHNIFQDYVVRCPCSHTMIFTTAKDRMICSYCGHWVYRDKKTELKYKMKEILR